MLEDGQLVAVDGGCDAHLDAERAVGGEPGGGDIAERWEVARGAVGGGAVDAEAAAELVGAGGDGRPDLWGEGWEEGELASVLADGGDTDVGLQLVVHGEKDVEAGDGGLVVW